MPALASRFRLAFVVVGLAWAAKVLPGCGSSGAGQAGGVDASSVADGSLAGNVEGGGIPGIDATGQTDAGGIDAPTGAFADSGSWLDGSMAFGVHYALLVPQNLQIACNYAPGPSTGYGDFVIIMTDVDLSSGCDGGTLTGLPDPGAGHPFVRIEVKSPSYRADGGALTIDGGPVAAIASGTYPIGFDSWTTDVCMLAGTNGLALVDVMRFTDNSCCSAVTGDALSGTVTLTTVDEGHVAGSFQVTLASPDGGAAGAVAFSGHFDTKTCPGTTQ